MISLRNQALSLIPEKRWSLYTKISCSLQNVKNLLHMQIPSGYGLKINCIYSAPIRKTALSELSFCSCGYFAKEIFKIMLIHASMIRKFMKIALALNRYKELIIT